MSEVAYELALPTELASIRTVFHVSILKKSQGNPALILPAEGLGVDKTCPTRSTCSDLRQTSQAADEK